MKNVKTIFCLISLLIAGITNVWGEEWDCGNVTVDLTSTTLTISPKDGTNGRMDDLTEAETLWRASVKRGNVRTIIIEDGVTYIGKYAFYYCLSITSIKVPLSVTSFGSKAFYYTNSAQKVYYEGSPNQWANIDFEDASSHPFYGNTGAHHIYFDDQTSTETTELVLAAGITKIKQYAFYKANQITNVYIPGTVTEIEQHALDCGITRLYTNKSVVPTTGTAAISWTTSSDTYLYLREDATSSYNAAPWYMSSSRSSDGAYYLGYSGDNASIKAACSWKGTRYVSKVDGDIGTISWTLAENGTLTLDGTGDISKTFDATNSSDNVLPWYRFRYLVNKVVVKGGITGLTSALSWAYGLSEIEINQNTIPTSTTSEANINNNFNTKDKIAVKIKPAALADASASNLGSAPWNSDKLDIALSDAAVYGDEQANTLLTNIKTYVDEPFDLTVNRTLSTEYLNTFCSPVAISDISGTFGAETYLYEFDNTTIEDDVLKLNFEEATEIEAGKPYLIQPANSITSLSFSDVDPSDIETEGGSVSKTHAIFYGTLVPTSTEDYTESKNFIFLLANNKLTYATEGTLKGLRAYFLLRDGYPASMLARRPVLNFDDEQTPTAIDKTQTEVKAEKVMENGVMYIIKNGVKYSVMGERVK